jgi:response regulator RpfG family c-di-GMP phosphodiesterase
VEQPQEVRLLIADTNAKFQNSLARGYNAALEADTPDLAVPVFPKNARECQKLLSDRSYGYTGVFVNPSFGTPAWLAVIKSTHQYRPGVPTFVIYEAEPKITKEEARKLGVHSFLPKPLEYADFLKHVKMPPCEFLPSAVDAQAEAKKEAARSQFKDDDFMTVDLKDPIGDMRALFDLFVRMPDGRYIKLLNAGDVLSKARLDSYRKKGVTVLHIMKKAQADYLEYCDQLVKQLLNDPNATLEEKNEQISSQGQGAMGFLQSSGISGPAIERAKEYVGNVTEMINGIAANDDKVKDLLKDVAAYEHSVACTTVSGLMLKYIGAKNPTIFNSIGMACFFHDLGLLGLPPEVMSEDESLMSAEQKEIFYFHPETSAKLVKKIKGVPPAVADAIAEHHLRIGNRGFPKELQAEEVNLIAEVVGISEELVKLIKRAESEPGLNPYEAMRKVAATDFSQKIRDAFLRVIAEK